MRTAESGTPIRTSQSKGVGRTAASASVWQTSDRITMTPAWACPARKKFCRSGYMDNPLRQNFFRAGHAHAGVIVILSLVCQTLADAAVLPTPLLWLVRIGVPLSAVLISAGFFFSALPPTASQANGAVSLIYVGAVVLALDVVSLGIGLLRAPQTS